MKNKVQRAKRGRHSKDKPVIALKARNYLIDFGARLAILLLFSVNSLALFYAVFTPLTVLLSSFLISLFYPMLVEGNVFYINSYVIELINACIAGSAYYLLLILNLLTKGISISDRIKIFLFTSLAFLLVNVLRIMILIVILVQYGLDLFNKVHITFWILGSTIIVVGIWILTVKIFRVKGVPIYSDLKEVFRIIKK